MMEIRVNLFGEVVATCHVCGIEMLSDGQPEECPACEGRGEDRDEE